MEDMFVEELICEMISEDACEPCELACVSFVEDENLVIVYDRNQENRYRFAAKTHMLACGMKAASF